MKLNGNKTRIYGGSGILNIDDINLYDIPKVKLKKKSKNEFVNFLLRHKKTSIYLLNTFAIDNKDFAVVIIEYWNGSEQKLNRLFSVLDKDAIKV